MNTRICQISNKEIPLDESYRADELRPSIYNLIKKDYPDFSMDSYISIEELNKYRKIQLGSIIQQEKGDVDKLEQEVVDAITNNKILSENIEDYTEEKLTFGQRTADKVAGFGGSWKFIIFFFCFIVCWISINVWYIMSRPFDPYPFILLNLILSCLAAIQAPIIMMSQNRQEQKDRLRNEHDYKVNLKAELEIKIINEKIDHIITNQNRRVFEAHEIQTDILEDIMNDVHTLLKQNKV